MRSIGSDRRGATLVERLILVALLALALIGGFYYFGASASAKVDEQALCVSTLNGNCGQAAGSEPGAGSESDDGSHESGNGSHESGNRSHSEAVTPGGHHGNGASPHGPHAGGPDERGFFRKSWDAIKGFGLQVWSVVPYTWQTIRHPWQTLQGVGFVLRHPVVTGRAVGGLLGEARAENPQDFWGRVTAEVVTLPFVVTKLSKIKYLAALEHALQGSKYAHGVHRAEKIHKILDATGKVQHGAHAGHAGEHEHEQGHGEHGAQVPDHREPTIGPVPPPRQPTIGPVPPPRQPTIGPVPPPRQPTIGPAPPPRDPRQPKIGPAPPPRDPRQPTIGPAPTTRHP